VWVTGEGGDIKQRARRGGAGERVEAKTVSLSPSSDTAADDRHFCQNYHF